MRFQCGMLTGRYMVFSSTHGGPASNLYRQAANGGGVPERLTDSPNTQMATSMTPDGRAVIFHEITPAGGRDLHQLTLPRPGELARSEELMATRDDERNGIVSPNGRWLSYESDRSGQFEIYVRPFPNVEGGEWSVSTGGGRQAVWARSGRELFYVALDGSLLTVSVDSRDSEWSAGAPQKFSTTVTSPAAACRASTTLHQTANGCLCSNRGVTKGRRRYWSCSTGPKS